MKRFVAYSVVGLLVGPLLGAAPGLSATADRSLGDPFAALTYRHIGPIGNRVPAVSGVAGDPSIYFAGTASGGIFRSQDGGVRWEPVFDDTPASSIGALAVAPSDPNVIWVGTGESFIRSNVSIGDGVYRSVDGGTHWQHVGLPKSGRIGRIAVHPDDPETVFVAALGHLYGPQQERGVYRTENGGESWERVLFVDEDTGAVDLAMDPNNPRILFAATWQMEMSTSGRQSGGPGSGLFVSRDAGSTWERLEGTGLPEPPWGRIGLAISADNSRRIYALIETSSNPDFAPVEAFQGVLWRSDDGGESWTMVNADNTLTQRPLYYTRAVAAPDDEDEITFLAVQQSLSRDGGVSIEEQNSGWDHHDMWIDPLDPDRRIVGHDGGVSITTNRGKSWFRPQLPAAQMYHVATDDRIPYNVYGNRQDGPTAMGPSNTLTGSEIPVGAWRTVGGCEVGFSLPDRSNPDAVWSGCYDGILELHNTRSGHSRDVSVWPAAIESWPASEMRFRIQWQAPLAQSPHDPNTVYYGSQYVHRTRDGGQSWEVISPDLTTADPALMRRSGGLTLDDSGPTVAPTLFAIAESPVEAEVLWAGSNDGKVHVTRDGGGSWVDVTEGLKGLPPLGTISNIEPSQHHPGAAYLVVDRHQEGDTRPYVYATRDYGESWRSIRGDLPTDTVFAYAHCVREDPVRAGLLYLGTHNGVWVSWDDGEHWHVLNADLPPSPAHWLTVQPRFSDLVVATYGRGFWILDDVTPLREWGSLDGTQPHLFRPRMAYRFRSRAPEWSEPDSPAAGTNPEYGATLHYFLDEEVSDAVALVVSDADGREVRRLDDLSGLPGLHRVVWNLRGERTPEVELRTPVEGNPHVEVPRRGYRPLSDGGRLALLAPPGSYRIDLEIDGQSVAQRTLEVLRDPASTAPPEALADQTELLGELRGMVESAALAINRIERVRSQLLEFEERRKSTADEEGENAELFAMAERVDDRLKEIEGHFFDLRLTGARQDTLRWKRLLYARLTYLARRIGHTDDRPTDAQRAVFEMLASELAERLEEIEQVFDNEVAEFNARATELGPAIIVPELPVPEQTVSQSPDAATGASP